MLLTVVNNGIATFFDMKGENVDQMAASECGTVRVKWIGRSGSLGTTLGTTSHYYPDGYQTHGEETLSREQWRRSWIITVFREA